MEEIRELLNRLVAIDREYRSVIKEAQMRGGNAVHEARKILGLTQAELAQKLNVHHTYISKIENGRTVVSKVVLRHIAQLMAGEEIDDGRTLAVANA